MIIDHIGIAVRSITEGVEHWEKVFGYEQLTEIVVNTRQKVKVVFLTKKDSLTVKLIEPVDETSSIFEFAKKGGGLHHLCFKCDNMEYELRRLNTMGLRVLAGPQPGEAFDNENIAFLYAKQGLNIELIDTDKKANRLDSYVEF
jgi:methylmalonyl-CoA/ethylmalonyl-CoA epimerase